MPAYSPLYEAQTWQVLYPRKKLSCQGKAYLAFRIHDGEAHYTAHAWEGQYQGPPILTHGQQVYITGQWTEHQGQRFLHCRTISPTEAEPQALRKSRTRVRTLLLRLPSPVLRQFVAKVFEDNRLLQAFMTLPASTGYHHGYPGGLFIHSVDTAWQVYRHPRLQGMDKAVAVVAALLHDIGKVNSYTPEGKLTPHGSYVDHDSETLVLLNPALQWLDTRDQALGRLLRHHLTWQPKKRSSPRRMGALYVRFADQASTAEEMCR